MRIKQAARSLFIACCMLVLPLFVFSQNTDTIHFKTDSTTLHKARLAGLLAAQGTLYFGSLAGLYFVWYSEYPQSSFHFFNDLGEWQGVDKAGHMTTAYYISRLGYESYRWAGIKPKAATWYGGLLAFSYLLNIEILDGFSAEWGFSVSDFAANTLGCALFIGQQLGWREQRLNLKYSFHPTKYPQYRPDLLGESLIQQMVKDYNGQTYWLSANIYSFLPKSSKFPRWLDVSVGYGAEGMIGAGSNPATYNGETMPEFTRYKKFYLSLDVDLTRIRVHSKVAKGIFMVLSFIKIPFPALEINTLGTVRFYPIYF